MLPLDLSQTMKTYARQYATYSPLPFTLAPPRCFVRYYTLPFMIRSLVVARYHY